jgi:hypothetical protein
MKRIVLASSLLIGMVGVGLLVGCGGGGSNDKSNNNNNGNSSAALDMRSVETVGQNIAELVPGCVFTSNTVATTLNMHNVRAYKAVYSTLTTPVKQTRQAGQGGTMQGTCGGTITTSGTESNMQFTFNNYCTGGENIHTTINGTLSATINMQGSGENQVLQSASVSTGSAGIKTTTVENGIQTTESLYLNALEYTAGNPNRLTINELKITSTEEGTYRLTNVEINQYGDPETGTVEIKSATYYDPEIGAVTLSTSQLPIGENATGPGSFTISRNGESATFKTNDISSAKFDVVQNGKTIGALDCSATLTEIQ